VNIYHDDNIPDDLKQYFQPEFGLESTPDLYVKHLVAIFSEARRVLRKDGTLWLNLGDCYAANRGYQVTDSKHTDVGNTRGSSVPTGLKPKDLVGIPWRVAFALQADGWYLRSDIIWAKANPMPESVRDRPTSAHEHVFLLAKSERYFFDADAIREQSVCGDHARNERGLNKALNTPGQSPHNGLHVNCDKIVGRNSRNVWTVATQPYPDAHFAVWPEKLVSKMILAGSGLGDVVLDPFMGSGTTGVAAIRLGRKFIGIETSAEYCEMARNRIKPVAAQGNLFTGTRG